MTSKRSAGTAIGVGAAACVACCAGPILGFLATIGIGIGTVAGVLLFGVVGLAVAALFVTVLIIRQRHRRLNTTPLGPVTVTAPTMKTR